MALATYTDVRDAIRSDWLHRSDVTTAQCDDFIDLFESDFNATVRAREMEQVTTLTATDGYLLHPSNWLGWKEIRTTSSTPYDLEPAGDEIAIERTSGESAGAYPRYYKVSGSRTNLYPANAAGDYKVKYWEGVGLSSGANWLLTRYPGAYLYGGLLQATAFIANDPRIPMWQQAYELVLQRIKADTLKQSWSGQVLTMKPQGVV